MEKVLLAIDGMFPDKRIVEYALDFSRRIRADLDILHIVDPEIYGGCVKRLQKQVGRAKGCFEQAMMAATFAESGEHNTARALMNEASTQFNRLLSEADKKTVRYRVKIRAGNTDREIVEYVRRNKGVVLAIYDAAPPPPDAMACVNDNRQRNKSAPAGGDRDKLKTITDRLHEKLAVPLVVRNRSDAYGG